VTYFPQEIIRRKRNGETLATGEIEAFVRGLVDGSFTEGQVAALAMAVFFRGMDMAERVALTRAMMRSGGSPQVCAKARRRGSCFRMVRRSCAGSACARVRRRTCSKRPLEKVATCI